MGRKVTLNLDADTEKKLLQLADALGYPPDLAAVYAVRLVSACMREGLIHDMPARAWPEEAKALTGGGARVLRMPMKKSAAQGD
jgi:hypothetical protein